MNLLLNLSATYRQSLVAGNVAEIDQPENAGNSSDSPYAEMMGVFQALKQKDPTLYARVKREVTASLQAAAQAANDAVDIREMVKQRRTSRVYSITERLNRLAYILYPASPNR